MKATRSIFLCAVLLLGIVCLPKTLQAQSQKAASSSSVSMCGCDGQCFLNPIWFATSSSSAPAAYANSSSSARSVAMMKEWQWFSSTTQREQYMRTPIYYTGNQIPAAETWVAGFSAPKAGNPSQTILCLVVSGMNLLPFESCAVTTQSSQSSTSASSASSFAVYTPSLSEYLNLQLEFQVQYASYADFTSDRDRFVADAEQDNAQRITQGLVSRIGDATITYQTSHRALVAEPLVGSELQRTELYGFGAWVKGLLKKAAQAADDVPKMKPPVPPAVVEKAIGTAATQCVKGSPGYVAGLVCKHFPDLFNDPKIIRATMEVITKSGETRTFYMVNFWEVGNNGVRKLIKMVIVSECK